MNLFEEKKTPYGLMFLNCMTNLWSLYTENDNHMQVKITIYKHNILINMWFAICRSYNVALIKKRTTHLVNWKKTHPIIIIFFGSTKTWFQQWICYFILITIVNLHYVCNVLLWLNFSAQVWYLKWQGFQCEISKALIQR